MRPGILSPNSQQGFPYYAIAPAVILFVLLGFYPSLQALLLSLQDYDLTSPEHSFIGLENYRTLIMEDDHYLYSVAFTIVFGFVATALELVVGFTIAYLLADKSVSHRFSSMIRTGLLVPFVSAPVVMSYTFKTLIYDQTFGYLNYFLRMTGSSGIDLFKGVVAAPVGVLVMEVILRTPFIAIVLYAGISSIDESILDAADIDGVSWWGRIRLIVLPLIRPVMVIGFVIRFMDALKMFDEMFVVTGGGPGYVTENISLFAAKRAFVYFEVGYAAAAAFLFLLLIVVLVSLPMRRAFEGAR